MINHHNERKGGKLTNEAVSAVDLFLERLHNIADMTSKKMFGCYEVFNASKMFALVNLCGEVHVKSDDLTRTKSVAAGSPAYGIMPYFSIPETVFSDRDKMLSRAWESIKYPDKGRFF